MIDTAKLTAAVETLQGYCEQVRLVMNARGYDNPEIHLTVRGGHGVGSYGRGSIGVYDDKRTSRGDSYEFFPLTALAEALAYAQSRPSRPTHESIAATLGITPDGRVLASEPDPVLCEACEERPATEEWGYVGSGGPMFLCDPCADKERDRAVERAAEG